MKSKILKSVLLSILVLAVGAAGLALQATQAIAAPGDSPIGGEIFIDFDRDGAIGTNELLPDNDPSYPPGGVAVTVYDSDGNSVPGVVTSTGAGVSWTADVTGLVGSDFRVEFDISAADQAAGFSDTFLGPDSSSSVTFASAGDSNISFGVMPASVCSGSGEGHLWSTCFINGERGSGGPSDVIIGLDYDDPQNFATIGEKADFGSVWGLAYDQWTGTLYSASFLKRRADFGPEGIDGLYWSDGNGGSQGSVSLDTLGGTTYGTDLTGRNLGAFDNIANTDIEAFGLIGTRGLGDIDLTPDGRNLMVANLETNQIDVYDVTAVPTGGNPVYLRSVAIANPGCSNGDFRIFAITAIDADTAYTGVTCTAETSQSTADLEAHVVQFNVSGAGATPAVLSVPLDYERGCGLFSTTQAPCNNSQQPFGTVNGNFLPWIDDETDLPDLNTLSYPQAMFTDIEIGDDGSLVLGFADRWGHMGGWRTNGGAAPSAQVAGELLNVCNTSGDPANPTWVVEGQAGCAGNFVSAAGTGTNQPDYFSGPNGLSEFYDDGFVTRNGNNGHTEISNGGLYIRPGSGELVASVMDPIDTRSGGLRFFDSVTGASNEDVELYRGFSDQGYFGKAAGIGDVEGCFLPVGLGDFVWLDIDQDGIQDPDELALEGVTVTITGGSLSGPIVVTTDANGQWDATFLDGLVAGESYTIEVDPTTATNLPAGINAADLFATTQDVGNDSTDSDIDPTPSQ